MGCYNSVILSTPIEIAWETIQDFHDMSWAPNVVTSCEAVGEKGGTELGAKRILNGAFHETLLALDAHNHTIRYSIDDGPDAVSKDNVTDYVGEVCLHKISENNTTLIVWKSNWGNSSGGVQEFCDPIYQALLSELKNHFR